MSENGIFQTYKDNRSTYIYIISEENYSLISDYISENRKTEIDISDEEILILINYFKLIKLKSEPKLFLNLIKSNSLNSEFNLIFTQISGTIFELEQLKSSKIKVRENLVDQYVFNNSLSRLYLIKKNPNIIFLFALKSDIDLIIDTISQAVGIRRTPMSIGFRINLIEALADREKGRRIVRINSESIVDRDDDLIGANLKSGEDIRDADWYPDVRDFITTAHIVTEDNVTLEISTDGKMRFLQHVNDIDRIKLINKYLEDINVL